VARIKINLLPPGIYEKKIVRNIAILFAVLAMAIAGAGVGYRLKLGKDIAVMTAQADEVERKKAIVDDIKKKAADERAKIQPMKDKIAFIEAVYNYNEKWPALYEELARYTYGKVVYHSVTPTQDGLEIVATIPSIGDVGRFLLNMYRASHIFSSVAISGLPGYPPGGGAGAGSSELAAPPAYRAEGGPLPTGVSPYLYRYGGVSAAAAAVARAEAAKAKGLTLTVSCRLKELITPPVPPGAAAPSGVGQTMPGQPIPGQPMPAPPTPTAPPPVQTEPPMGPSQSPRGGAEALG